MPRESLVLLLGVVVLATQYLGIPEDWKQWVFVVSGVLLIAVGYSLRRSAFFRSIEVAPGERRGEAFVEHKAPMPNEEHKGLSI